MGFLDEIADEIKNQQVLNAMERVDRRLFLPDLMQSFSEKNSALPIECEQTISQPLIVGLMSEALVAHSPRKLLEIGTGSGYQAAILACLVDEVYSVERHVLLHQKAEKRLYAMGYANVTLKKGDGWLGWEEYAPFDGIIVTAAASEIPENLFNQLAIGGVMIVPVGEQNATQKLKKIVKKSQDDYSAEDLLDVLFVPFVKGAVK